MFHRLCGSPSIPLSFNLAIVVPRRSTYRVSYGTERVESSSTKYSSFTAWTTRVSNPVRSPRFRSSASVSAQSAAFAVGVPPDICAFHRYTRNSTLLYRTQVTAVSGGISRLSLELSHLTYRTAYELFTPNKSGQRSVPTCYRGCWHVVGRTFFCRYRQFRPC